MEFSSNHLITANNVIEKVRLTYGKCSILQLFNGHGRELNSQEIVESARVYTVKRQPRWSSERGKKLYLDKFNIILPRLQV